MRLKLIGEAGLVMNQVTHETEPGSTDASGGGGAASDGFSPSRHQPIKFRAAAIPEQDECADTAPYGKAQDGLVYPRRRRILTGSAAGAGVFLAMQAKTALGAGICQSPSAQMSGNQSPRPGNLTCWGGRSPGYWKQPQHFLNWRGLTAPTFNSGVLASDCQSGIANITPCDIALNGRGTLLSAIFQNAPAIGVWEVLVWPSNYPTATGVGTGTCALTGGNADVFGDKGQLLRHLACAYLNASASTDAAWYPITTTQVQAMWDAVSTGVKYSGMDAAGIILYISGMYDTGVPDSLEGCKKT